jgi:pilus assembly protein CpaC
MNIDERKTKRTSRGRLAPVMAAVFAMTAAMPLPLAAQPEAAAADAARRESPQEPEHRFHLYVGETRVIKLNSPLVKTAIGNGKVISTAMVNTADLLIIASDAGRSTLHLWLKDGTEVTYAVEVGLNSPEKTHAQVRDLLGQDDGIRISLVGNRVILQAQTLKPAQVQLIGALQKAFPDQIVPITGGDVALEERTVHVNAQLVEIKRSALERLGIEWDQSAYGPGVAIAGDMASNRYIRGVRPEDAPESIKSLGYVPPFRTALSLATVIGSRINLLRQNGDAYVVAEPRLTARCGGKADFTSGGELPIPVQNGLGSTNVEFKEYGIRLAIEPQCDQLGNIRAKVATEVSQIDQAVAVMGVPGLLTRKAESELDLIEGQSMLLSGLASYAAGEGANKVPFLGSLPLLGHLFKSNDAHGERSELIVIITPSFITSASDAVQQSLHRRRRLIGETNDKLAEQGVQPLDWTHPSAPVALPETPGMESVLPGNTPRYRSYAMTGDAPWRPLRIYDDGQSTIIEMPEGIPADRAPTLLVAQAKGEVSDTPVHYRIEGSRYIVESVFERAVLVAGAGFYRQSVTIEKQP